MPPKHFLTSTFRVAYEEYFSPEQQRNAVDTLQAHIAEVRDGSEEQQRELGVLKPRDTTPEQIEQRLAAYLDKCYWQLAQFYRYAVPCRIAEAEQCLREVLRYAQVKGGKRDVDPELYLAVAIHQVQGKEEEALSLFSSAFNHFENNDIPPPGPRSELWARANWARLLRRLDRVREAEEQEQAILEWVVSHPLVLPPAKLQALVSGETTQGVLVNISGHPDVQAAVENARQRLRRPTD